MGMGEGGAARRNGGAASVRPRVHRGRGAMPAGTNGPVLPAPATTPKRQPARWPLVWSLEELLGWPTARSDTPHPHGLGRRPGLVIARSLTSLARLCKGSQTKTEISLALAPCFLGFDTNRF
eukprot:scaffold37889_cov30-Tisochrysis_lutea.AAC.1